jgi:hypothetical protein
MAAALVEIGMGVFPRDRTAKTITPVIKPGATTPEYALMVGSFLANVFMGLVLMSLL